MKRNNEKRDIGIKWKILILMAAFTAFVLLVIWLFQVVLLNVFYERTKLSELETAANDIVERLGDENSLKESADALLAEKQIFSGIYRMENGELSLYGGRFIGKCYLDNATVEDIENIIEKAELAGGTYYFRESDKSDRPDGNKDRMLEIVYVNVVNTEDDGYVVVLDMIYTPLDATVNTLNRQFLWIAAILLVGAVAMTVIISKSVSSPVIKMTESAKKLAKGNYDADFSGDGCRETQELAETLNYASSELAKTDKLQKELISNISHDLRTPLTLITGYGEVMRDIPGENTPENIQAIIDETTRLSGLVNDLLDISKIQAGTVKFEKEKFNLTETIRNAMTRYSKLIEHDGFKIEFFADTDVFVVADPTRMLQVIYNLINNAVNYAGEDKRVWLTQTVNGDRVRIAVSDNGEGIPPENLTQIWDRYYKVDKLHKRAVVGTGLGLSIVKGILESHGATYGVESAVGRGSTFWFEMNIEK